MIIKGIYTITNLIDNKIYVGLSSDINSRERNHMNSLNRNAHTNVILQNAYNKYGKGNFKFEILEECCEELLYSQENYWCNMLNTHNRSYGYNIEITNPYKKGRHSNETKLKLRLKNIGKKLSEKTKKLISQNSIGKVLSQETRDRQSKSKKGLIFSKEHKDKLSIANSKAILQLSLSGDIIKEWESAKNAMKTLGFFNIHARCRENKAAYGFKWRYK